MVAELVILDWEDVVNTEKQLTSDLERAYSNQGLGLLAIRNVPGFVQAKHTFLPMAHQLAHLSEKELETLSDPDSLYNAGWSYGKEKLGRDKLPDLAKASFYYNPVKDVAGTEQDRELYPLSYPKNRWPSEQQTTRIPGFEAAAKQLGTILLQAVVALAPHLDAYAAASQNSNSSNNSYPPQLLYSLFRDTDKVKARLLYYYPLQQQQDGVAQEDSWIGWHNDSGFLTALAGDIYIHHDTGDILEASPDPSAGLYVEIDNNGAGIVQHVVIPSDCLAIQVGECTQIVTGGALRATPHCVRGSQTVETVARISLACFVDSHPSYPLHAPTTSSTGAASSLSSSSVRVPPLQDRWTDGMTFGDFLTTTFRQYYEWSPAGGGGRAK